MDWCCVIKHSKRLITTTNSKSPEMKFRGEYIKMNRIETSYASLKLKLRNNAICCYSNYRKNKQIQQTPKYSQKQNYKNIFRCEVEMSNRHQSKDVTERSLKIKRNLGRKIRKRGSFPWKLVHLLAGSTFTPKIFHTNTLVTLQAKPA